MRQIAQVIILVSQLILACSHAMAEGMIVGFKSGLVVANVTGNYAQESELKPGFGSGLFINYALNDAVIIQPEVLFMQKGQMFYDGIGTQKRNLEYIDIPLLVKYVFPAEGLLTPGVFTGPYLGILTKAKSTYDYPGAEGEFDVMEYLKTLDFGLIFGAELILSVGSGGIILDMRYAYGLTTICTDEIIEEIEEQEGTYHSEKNRVFALLFGYGFAF